ncbi:hypothetical protein [Paenibacillus roseipurpureus]|uniref:Uncharacterized protein n=1 Tax=Paenibacillus roseopurpureus TaxID=2918901 RepID=A0AA96RJM1_9BACL|nr:hypothetical protein [Paenibacillus sp. MBLB1832]WNR43311.1 hypothetical protein MJB10_19660 [Paenibacillus sp. MBLB1832]
MSYRDGLRRPIWAAQRSAAAFGILRRPFRAAQHEISYYSEILGAETPILGRSAGRGGDWDSETPSFGGSAWAMTISILRRPIRAARRARCRFPQELGAETLDLGGSADRGGAVGAVAPILGGSTGGMPLSAGVGS